MLALILLLFTTLTLLNTTLLPLGEAPDETDHYQYHRFVARTGHPPLTEAERSEAGFKGGLAPLYYWLTAWPVALVGEATPPDIRRVDSKPERFIPSDGLGLNRLVHTLDEQWPWRGQPLAWHLVRLLSLPMGWVTLIATYALARRLVPAEPRVALGAAAFVALLPRFVISSAVINDDNLVFALTALLLLVQVLILQGDHRPRLFALFGLLFGLALVTKYFTLILIPEVMFTLFVATHHAPRTTHHAPRNSYLPFLGTLLLTAGPWFLFIALRFNRIDELGFIPGLAAALGEPQITEGLVGLLSGQAVRPPAATYPLPEWFGLLYRSFWFEYGWMRLFAPTWVYALFTLFLGAALLGLIRKISIYLQPQTTQLPPSPVYRLPSTVYLLSLHLALFLCVVLARYILSATIDTGQGRHLYPALPVIALAVALGLHALWGWLAGQARRRWSQRLLHISSYAFSLFCFINPALIALTPGSFILSHYPTLPVTITAPADLPIAHRLDLPVTAAFRLAGFETATSAAAGSSLPVTLYWRAETEVNQDYLVSLCLQDEQAQPVACLHQHFVDGRYPARAWEAGDTIIDSLALPIPTCYRLLDQPYYLQLDVWPLRPDSLVPQVEAAPLLRHTFSQSPIRLTPTDSGRDDQPQRVDYWQADQRLTGPATLQLRETVSQISYATEPAPPANLKASHSGQAWLPLTELITPLHLPCADGPTPFATLSPYLAHAALPPDTYVPSGVDTPISLSLDQRLRPFAPLTTTLSFSDTLSPLSLQLPVTNYQLPITNYQLPVATQSVQSPITSLPVTLRWQARRWMAEPLVISLKLLDKDFGLGGERIATLGDRYPNVLWAPTEVVEETYPLRLAADAPPGLYRLELSLIRQDPNLPDGFAYLPLRQDGSIIEQNLYPLTIRLLDAAHGTEPRHPLTARLGETIFLSGYDLSGQSPLALTLFWRNTAPIPGDYTVFTQLVGPDGQVWAQWDNPPQAGRYPTSAWLEDDQVVDRYQLTLREGAPPGEYQLLVGMYDPITGERLPAFSEGQPQPNNAVALTKLSLTP